MSVTVDEEIQGMRGQCVGNGEVICVHTEISQAMAGSGKEEDHAL
jgi:hypothetical protein